jgi:hypothetical protein
MFRILDIKLEMEALDSKLNTKKKKVYKLT